MPPLPVISDVFRVALHWTGPSPLNTVNVMHFRGIGGTPSGLNSALQTNMTASMWRAVSAFAAIDKATILPLDGASAGQEFLWSPNAKWTGTTNSESEVAPAVVVKHQTGFRGKKNRGRTFLGIIAEAAVATGSLDAVLLGQMQVGWDAFLVSMAASSYPLVVASYTYGTALGVTNSTVEVALGTQRRRQGRIRKAAGL